MTRKLLLSLLAITFMIQANAQIVYTDIDDGIPQQIDFDGDGNAEFDVTQGSDPGSYIQYFDYGADNNIHALGTLDTEQWDTPDCVDEGFTVDETNQWEGQGDCSLTAFGAGNSTITAGEDEFLAVRFNLSGGSEIYYGWIRFEMDSSGDFIYKDYAYNSTANEPILTGDTALSVNNPEFDAAVTLYPNPAKDQVNIENASAKTINKITVVDLLGRTVKEVTKTNSFDVSELNSGLYVINLFADGKKVVSKKLTVK